MKKGFNTSISLATLFSFQDNVVKIHIPRIRLRDPEIENSAELKRIRKNLKHARDFARQQKNYYAA